MYTPVCPHFGRLIVGMPVVDVRIMRMRMHQAFVSVPVRMGLARWSSWRMLMLVVLVVHVLVGVLELLVDVLMLVMLRQVEVDPKRHQRRGHQETPVDRIAEEDQR